MDGDDYKGAEQLRKEDAGVSSSQLSISAKEFYPSSYPYIPSASGDASSDEWDTSRSLEYSISELENKPQAFYDIAFPLASHLSLSLQNPDELALLIDTLFQKCISDANFRYSGARLFSFLHDNLQVEDIVNSFHSQLLTRCHQEFARKDELAAQHHSELVNVTLFLAELMQQFTTNDELMSILPGHVLELLSAMLHVGTDECIKGLVQTLKLSGAILDKYMSSNMVGLFGEIKSLIADAATTESIRTKLLNLCELRAQRWLAETNNKGPTESQTAADVAENDVYAEDCDEDHEEFDTFDSGNFEVIYDGDVPYVIPCEMDPDMEEEYERFIAHSEAQSFPSNNPSS